jgi:hypothetical protein
MYCLILPATLAWFDAALLAAPAQAQGLLAGYSDYRSLTAEMQELAKTPCAKVSSLGRTLGKREIWLVTLSLDAPNDASKSDDKPAILLLGNVHAPQLAGSELALRIAQRLAKTTQTGAADETQSKSTVAGDAPVDRARQLLQRYTVYIIPRPNPDASEAFFQPPYYERAVNLRSTDDDRDGALDEDPLEDLNGDGLITMLRIEDPSGPYLPHPADGRVLIKADPKKNEQGRYRLITEGIDNDHDELFNEDPPGGVSFNRNFSFQYPFFQPGAGPHQVSEIETRAVADFALTHPNIGLVLSFAPEDNLLEPWKSEKDSERVKTSVMSADAEHLNYLAEQYRAILGGSGAPESPKGEGSFVHWAYFHYGRWSLGARGWWIPKTPSGAEPVKSERDKKDNDKAEKAAVPAEEKSSTEGKTSGSDGAKSASTKDEAAKKPAAKNSDDKRGADELNALRWFEKQGVAGFVDWQPIEHPDFAGRKVEVGGFKPFMQLNPPSTELPALADKHYDFLVRLADWLPRLKIERVKVESLGVGVFRLTVKVLNAGFLPTQPAIGRTTEHTNPLQIKLDLPAGVSLVTGHPRQRLDTLSGNGGSTEPTWLLRAPADKPATIKITVYAAAVGSETTSAELK